MMNEALDIAGEVIAKASDLAEDARGDIGRQSTEILFGLKLNLKLIVHARAVAAVVNRSWEFVTASEANGRGARATLFPFCLRTCGSTCPCLRSCWRWL